MLAAILEILGHVQGLLLRGDTVVDKSPPQKTVNPLWTQGYSFFYSTFYGLCQFFGEDEFRRRVADIISHRLTLDPDFQLLGLFFLVCCKCFGQKLEVELLRVFPAPPQQAPGPKTGSIT